MATSSEWLHGPVIVPLDGRDASIRAVPPAKRIAAKLDAELKLLSIVEEEEDVETREKWLHDVSADFVAAPNASTHVVASEDEDVVATITSFAGDGGLLCMATAGKVSFHSGHFGSNAEGVARAIGRPLFMVGPHAVPEAEVLTQRVIVPVDGSELAATAVEIGGDLAAALDVPLWIVEVVSPAAVAAASAKMGGPVEGGDMGYVKTLARHISRARDLDVEYEILHSEDPDRAIVDFAGEDGTVVMSTHGRTGLGRLFAGSVTAGVVAHSRRAVVVLRPEGID